MMMRLMLLLLACMPFASSMQAGIIENFLQRKGPYVPPPRLHVLVAHDRPGVVIEVKGKYTLYNPHSRTIISTRYQPKRNFMQAMSDGLKWGEGFPGVHQLLIVPDNMGITTIVDGIEYRGTIYVYDVEGSINVVNDVDIEDYLHSLLAPAIRNSFSSEVLAALAIAARTNAYYQLQNPKSPYWSVDASQVKYHGYAMTDDSSPIARAIDATRYLIMSSSGKDADYAAPFAVQFGPISPIDRAADDKSRINMQQAEEMAGRGDHAAQILTRAFPGTSITLMHYSPRQ